MENIIPNERMKSIRLAKEALNIKSYNNLMNGCEGSKLLTFLTQCVSFYQYK